MKPKVLVTRALFPAHIELLAGQFDLISNQEDRPLARAELVDLLHQVDGAIITGSDRIDEAALSGTSRLKAVCSVSVGYNHIDVAACTAHGVMATNTPDVLTETTADLGFALMMAAARRMSESERWMRQGHWQRWALEQFLGTDIHHSTLGILGMGRIGQAIAMRATGFSMRVIYHNRSRLPAATEAECKASFVDRETLFRTSDHVMLVLPYSAQSHHTVGETELAWMKPGATLTNIARGGLIDEVAMAKAVNDGRLGGVGLDVFEGEPKVNPSVLELASATLTPHIGSASRATRDGMARLAIRNLVEALAGRVPPSLLNPEVL